jgi:hypothetical protein
MARLFGLEIEFMGDRAALVRELRAAGLQVRDARYTEAPTPGDRTWMVKTDASVLGGGELVGPPLDFDNPEERAQVDTAIAALRRAGARTADAAGIHVHVDARDLDARQVAAVGRFFAKYEDAIYRMASSGWNKIRSGSKIYAKPLTTDQKQGLMKVRNENGLKKAWYGENVGEFYAPTSQHGHRSRYCGLNLHSWFYRGTIEFRVFNSSLNAERIQCYIAMSVAIVQDARQGHRCSIKTAKPVGSMLQMDEAGQKQEFYNFAYCLRYRAGLSKDDLKSMHKFWADSKPQANIWS